MSYYAKRRHPLLTFVILTAVLAVYVGYALLRPLGIVAPTATALHLQSGTISNNLAWPAHGQAAVGINPSGVLATHNNQTAVPIASTAKVLTALAVLKKHPLASHQAGPTITLSDADVAIYNKYIAMDGSVTAVQTGENLTEFQMLQAILLPSANNIADSLAIWAFGSLDNYSAFTNGYIRQLGLTHTRIGSDASGYDPSTVSTAHDLVLLGEAAMQEPALAEIVGQTSADLPFAGTIRNVNSLLGTNNIIGVKTGNTPQAGGVFLAAKRIAVSGKELILVSAIVGAPSLSEAMVGSLPLLSSAYDNFASVPLLPQGATLGGYRLPWGERIAATTRKPLTAVIWRGSSVPTDIVLRPAAIGSQAGFGVGSVRVSESPFGPAQSVEVVLKSAISGPSVRWRLSHPV